MTTTAARSFPFAPRRAVLAALSAVLIGFAIAPSAWAEKGDRDKPINFSGDSGDEIGRAHV